MEEFRLLIVHVPINVLNINKINFHGTRSDPAPWTLPLLVGKCNLRTPRQALRHHFGFGSGCLPERGPRGQGGMRVCSQELAVHDLRGDLDEGGHPV